MRPSSSCAANDDDREAEQKDLKVGTRIHGNDRLGSNTTQSRQKCPKPERDGRDAVDVHADTRCHLAIIDDRTQHCTEFGTFMQIPENGRDEQAEQDHREAIPSHDDAQEIEATLQHKWDRKSLG